MTVIVEVMEAVQMTALKKANVWKTRLFGKHLHRIMKSSE